MGSAKGSEDVGLESTRCEVCWAEECVVGRNEGEGGWLERGIVQGGGMLGYG